MQSFSPAHVSWEQHCSPTREPLFKLQFLKTCLDYLIVRIHVPHTALILVSLFPVLHLSSPPNPQLLKDPQRGETLTQVLGWCDPPRTHERPSLLQSHEVYWQEPARGGMVLEMELRILHLHPKEARNRLSSGSYLGVGSQSLNLQGLPPTRPHLLIVSLPVQNIFKPPHRPNIFLPSSPVKWGTHHFVLVPSI